MGSDYEKRELTAEELDAQHAAELPDREALTTIDPVAAPTGYLGSVGIIPAPEPWQPAPPIEETM